MMADIFISYAHKDEEKAKLLASTFELKGWSVWWDIKIPPGRTWEDVIDEVLKSVKVIVCLWSKTSVKSREVRNEIKAAQEKVVPVFIEDVELPYDWRDIHAANLTDWQGTPDHEELLELMNAISTRLGKSERKGIREDHDAIIQKAPPEQVDIYSKDFLEIVDRFIRTEKTLTPEDKKVRLEFYTEYVDRMKQMKIDDKLKEKKRLNRQYLTEYGVQIAQLKQMLRKVRLYSGTGNDFPDDLIYALTTYQKAKGIKPIDGIFGPATFYSLITQLGLQDTNAEKED